MFLSWRDGRQSEYEVPHGRIDLSSCMTVKSAEQKTSKRNALEVSTHDTTYFMYANTEKVCIIHCVNDFVEHLLLVMIAFGNASLFSSHYS